MKGNVFFRCVNLLRYHLNTKGQDAIKLPKGWHNLTGVTPLAGDHPEEAQPRAVCGNEATSLKRLMTTDAAHCGGSPRATERLQG